MTKKQERHIIATTGTVLFLILVILVLWYIRLEAVAPEQEEGIEIAFVEDTYDLGGTPSTVPNPTPIPADAPAASSQPALSQPQPASPPEPIVSEEETLAIERARKEKEEREAAERKKKEKEDAERKKAQDLIAGIGFNSNGNGDSQNTGKTQGGGPNTNPVAKGTAGNSRISGLDGRGLIGKLHDPIGNYQHSGVVVVAIRVNEKGEVIYAKETTGTNTADVEMIQSAIVAAKKTKWTEGKSESIGTITYTFIVK